MTESVLQPRSYQLEMARAASTVNTLVVLPTGLGKTVIAWLVSKARLEKFEAGKVVMLAPTKPLAVQHSRAFTQFAGAREDEAYVMTGETDPARRSRSWRQAKFVFATPQTIVNDVRTGRIDFGDVVLLIFDEAHRSVKDYSYTELAKSYKGQASAPLILGLTASPGGTRQRAEEIRRNLFIERVDARTEDDPDIRPYVESTSLEVIKVPLPDDYCKVLKPLRAIYNEKIADLVEAGFLSAEVSPTKTVLLRARGPLASRLKATDEVGREPIMRLLADQGQAVVILHGIELLETQGIRVFLGYLQRLRDEPGSAASALIKDGQWRSIEKEAGEISGTGYPKLERLTEILADQLATKKDSRVIIFTQYRDTIDTIIERLKAAKIGSVRFVGQANRAGDKGLQQKQQSEVLERFRAGKCHVLVSSSIGEARARARPSKLGPRPVHRIQAGHPVPPGRNPWRQARQCLRVRWARTSLCPSESHLSGSDLKDQSRTLGVARTTLRTAVRGRAPQARRSHGQDSGRTRTDWPEPSSRKGWRTSGQRGHSDNKAL